MTLPFDLPALSSGFASLSPAARMAGIEAASAAARALSAILGAEARIQGRALPGAPTPRVAAARVAIDLGALPAVALLEVEPALVVRLVDRLAGGAGDAVGATALTPVEAAALDLLALAALDGVCSCANVEDALAPRLARVGAEIPSPLAIELDLSAGPVSGRARLLVPAAAVRALRGEGAPGAPAAALPIPASLRSGSTALFPDELEALSPGDVVLVEPPRDGLDVLVLPGGVRLHGRREEDVFHLEDTAMPEPHAQLPITLEVELGRVELSLAELARLEPGAALPLGLDRRGVVTLRAGERAVARGELVDIDGAVGVRVLSVEVAP